MDPAQFNTVHT